MACDNTSTTTNIKTNTTSIVDPEFGANNLNLYNQAQSAVKAGLAYTAKRYAQIDNQNTQKSAEKGTFPYDNSKSLHFVS